MQSCRNLNLKPLIKLNVTATAHGKGTEDAGALRSRTRSAARWQLRVGHVQGLEGASPGGMEGERKLRQEVVVYSDA